LYDWLAPQTVPAERGLKFQTPAPPFKIFWRRLHSPASNQLLLEMNDIVSTNAFAFVLFVRSLC